MGFASDRLAPAVGPSVRSQIVQEGWKDVTSGRFPVLDRAARVFGDGLEDPPKHTLFPASNLEDEMKLGSLSSSRLGAGNRAMLGWVLQPVSKHPGGSIQYWEPTTGHVLPNLSLNSHVIYCQQNLRSNETASHLTSDSRWPFMA